MKDSFVNSVINGCHPKERTSTYSGSSSDSSNNNFRHRRTKHIHQMCNNSGDYYVYSQPYLLQDPGPGVLNVYRDNMIEGMKRLREYSKISHIVAIDTEFPGTVVKISNESRKSADLYYENVKVNTDLLKPIQIGFSFFDSQGRPIDNQSTVQFNFFWDYQNDIGNQESLRLLEKSGIDFEKISKIGIDPDHFAESFITTGLLMNENIIWVGFHSSHDWAYILKIVTGWTEMPTKFADFQALLQIYFPKTIDLKTVALKCRIHGCGLQELSRMFKVERIGCQHQAGSDSKVTGETYFQLLMQHAGGEPKMEWFNQIFGLNFSHIYPNGFSPDENYEISSLGSDRSSPMSGGDATPDDEIHSTED